MRKSGILFALYIVCAMLSSGAAQTQTTPQLAGTTWQLGPVDNYGYTGGTVEFKAGEVLFSFKMEKQNQSAKREKSECSSFVYKEISLPDLRYLRPIFFSGLKVDLSGKMMPNKKYQALVLSENCGGDIFIASDAQKGVWIIDEMEDGYILDDMHR